MPILHVFAMEKFYNYLRKKHFVDYEDEEINDVVKAMNLFLNKLCDTFNEQSGILQIERLVSCGSMEERTTVWGEVNTTVELDPSKSVGTIEFDCLVVLRHFVPDIEAKPSCAGYRKLASKTLLNLMECIKQMEESESYKKALSEHEIHTFDTLRFLLLSGNDNASVASKNCPEEKPKSFEEFVSHQIELKLKSANSENLTMYKDLLRLNRVVSGSSTSVSNEFTRYVDIAVDAMCQSVKQNTEDSDGDTTFYEIEMTTGTLKYGRCLPGCQLVLHWKSKISDKILVIYADFVPAFQMPGSKYSEGSHFPTEDSDLPSYLVAKGCHTPRCVGDCWRWSHCLAEKNAIMSTSQEHRDVYKFIKIFNHSILSRRLDNNLKSYHIKTALLNHISLCKLTKPDITDCLGKTLEIVNSFIENEEVPHWKIPNFALVLKLDTCHQIVPLLLQFIFGEAVKCSPKRLNLTICCKAGRGNEVYTHIAYSTLSNYVCQVIEGKDCYKGLKCEIENSFIQAAELAPFYRQNALKYSLVVGDQSKDSTVIYQRVNKIDC